MPVSLLEVTFQGSTVSPSSLLSVARLRSSAFFSREAAGSPVVSLMALTRIDLRQSVSVAEQFS